MNYWFNKISGFCPTHQLVMLTAAVAFLTTLLFPNVSEAANAKITVTVGQSVTYRIKSSRENIKTVSIANSEVADVVVAGPREVLINGINIGRTTLVIWYEDNVSTIFDIVARGPFSDQQIELRVQIAEVNRSKASELGIDYLFSDKNSSQWDGGLFPGSVSTPTTPLAFFGGGAVEGLTGALKYVHGGTALSIMIHALTSNGVLRVLAEPNVVAASGQEASFLSGGEIPVPISSAGAGGGSNVTIKWKEFGVKIVFVPTIVDSGVMNLQVAVEVSSLDFGNGIELSGFRVPALRSRKAETTIEMKDQETLVIGGLFMEEENRVRTRIPILGHLPLLGYLFSSTRNVKVESELLIVVSPHIIRALPRGVVVPLPGMTPQTQQED